MKITQPAYVAPAASASADSAQEQLASMLREDSLNPAYKLIYEQWKQSILLSDGITDEMNTEW